MPGIVEHRFNQLQEIEAILNYMNIECKRLRSTKFKKYLENYQRALSSRDVEKYVDGEASEVSIRNNYNNLLSPRTLVELPLVDFLSLADACLRLWKSNKMGIEGFRKNM